MSSEFETRLERRVRDWAESSDREFDAHALTRAAVDAGAAQYGGSFGFRRLRSAGRPHLASAWLLLLIGLLLTLAVGIFVVGALLRDSDRPLARNGLIAYSVGSVFSNPNGPIHLMNPDGSDDRIVGFGTCPRFTSDGTKLIYRSGSDPTEYVQGVLTVASADGSEARQLDDKSTFAGVLSPDGTKVAELVLVSDEQPAREIQLRDVGVDPPPGTLGEVLVPARPDGDHSYQSLTWSPDGRSIAFAVMKQVDRGDTTSESRVEVNVVDVASGQVTTVSKRPGAYSMPLSWSPDSSEIAYLGLADGAAPPVLPPTGQAPSEIGERIFTVGADGSGDRQRSERSEQYVGLAWSPDGNSIAFEYFEPPQLTFGVLEIQDDSLRTRATSTQVRLQGWSPDSSTLLLSGIEPAAVMLLPANLASDPETITTSDERLDCVSWQAVPR
ncbi:MAG TPA: hypothetical protein VEX62_07200 [Candidatus Limnocylindrales bacterium]|nr:hypothetical protein [Candidatus Limnocylindrales bacterium]